MLNTVSKAEFAKLVNLSPGRVSQLITAGKLKGALVGDGRSARVDVDKARDALKLRLDPGQRLGNGAETRLGEDTSDDLDLKLKQAKLAQAEAGNRRAREDELTRRGVYVRAEHASAEAGKLASTILQMFEGGLTDVAAEIAAEFKLTARDVTHLMRKRFRDVRARVSEQLASEAAGITQLIEEEGTE